MIILRQKEFGGRSVYEGLSDKERASLRNVRDKIASEIKKKRKMIDIAHEANLYRAKDQDKFEFAMTKSRENRKRRNRISELLKAASEFNDKTDKNPKVDRGELRREFRKRTEDLFK